MCSSMGIHMPFPHKKSGKILTCRFAEKWVQISMSLTQFPFLPLGGPRPPASPMSFIVYGALIQKIFEWGESAPIWGRYGGLKIWLFQYLARNCSKTGKQKSTIFGMLEDVVDLCGLRDFKQKINFWWPRVLTTCPTRYLAQNLMSNSSETVC